MKARSFAASTQPASSPAAKTIAREPCLSLQLSRILRLIEVPLRLRDQPVIPHAPFLMPAYPNRPARSTRTGVRARQRPVIDRALTLNIHSVHPHHQIRKRRHESLRSRSDRISTNSRRTIIDRQRPVRRKERRHPRGILTTPRRRIPRCEFVHRLTVHSLLTTP